MTENTVVLIETNEEAVLASVQCQEMEPDPARTVQEQVGEAARKSPGLPVVLDLSRVKLLPSLAIGSLVSLWRQLKQDNRRFILVGVQAHIRETLTICRLDKLFEIYDSQAEALSRIRKSSQ